MLPAADLAEILTNPAALNLQPTTAAQILAAVFAPLLRSSGDPELGDLRIQKRRYNAPVGRDRERGREEPRAASTSAMLRPRRATAR